MASFWIIAGALTNVIGVILGAFGAHFFKTRLLPQELAIYETAVRYLFIHALALLFLGLFAMQVPNARVNPCGILFLVGIIIFSGSLMLLIFTKQNYFGAITPLGGLSFIAGWLWLVKIGLSKV